MRDADYVIISTPTKTHYEITKMALSKKKHVMCEKPLCLKLNQVNDILISHFVRSFFSSSSNFEDGSK